MKMFLKLSFFAAEFFIVQIAYAACPSVPTAERFMLNGDQVTDKRSGLVWRRCSVGQSWHPGGSTCTGSARIVTRMEAEDLAKANNASHEGLGKERGVFAATAWRLPNAMELMGLADKGCQGPSIDKTAFPVTPSQWFWTSTPYEGDSVDTWGVNFYNAHASYYLRYSDVYIRLVRSPS